MQTVTANNIGNSELSSKQTPNDRFLKILIERNTNDLDELVQELAKKHNPKMLSIMKVESFFKKHTEFDSRSQLLRALNGSMKATVLNTIIARLASENKVVVNDDHSLTWINTEGNDKINSEFEKAIPL